MLAFFTSEGRGAADRVLAELAGLLEAEGLRLAGAVQVNLERTDQPRCDMELRILGTEETVRISQDLGRGSRGCRLDPDGLERAVGLAERGLDARADLVFVNKFGKHEAEGRGFRPLIAQALADDIPVLTAVNRSNLEAFLAFTDGIAEELPPELAPLLAWCRRATAAPELRSAGA
jgi:nucleoside-triphosphatase THEP1